MTFDSPEELFDRYILLKKLGKRVPDEVIKNNDVLNVLMTDTNIFIDVIIQLYKGRIPSPNIFFIDSSILNAYAFKEKDEYFIGINIGVVRLFNNLFYHMLSHPEIFPGIGDVSKEVIPPLIKDIHVIDAKIIEEQSKKVSPIDNTRLLYATGLCIYAFRFLICHEYGHILKGHVDYFDQNESSALVSDGVVENDGNEKGENNWIRQCIEIDADAFSILANVDYLLLYLKFQLHNKIPIIDGMKTVEEVLNTLIISVYSMFRLIGRELIVPEKLYSDSYPPPGIRTYFIGLVLFRDSRFTEIFNNEDVEYAMDIAEKALFKLTSDIDFSQTLFPFTPLGEKYIEFLLDKLPKLDLIMNGLRKI